MSISINSNEYKIINNIKENNISKIYKVFNKKNNKYYSLKQISIKDLNEEEIEYIQNESNILSTINNEHIVKYYDSSKENDNFYILTEYAEGQNLIEFIKKYKSQKHIDDDILYKIIFDLCSAIKEIHNKNIIHRGLKPENIMIVKDSIKICGFGNSKKINAYGNISIGTINYMAPEMIQNEKYNNKVDIWALGCIIYELLTLNICFQGDNLFGIVNKIINEKHGKIDLKYYDKKWQNLIDLLLQKEHKKRPDINGVFQYLKKIEPTKIITKKLSFEEFNKNKKKKNFQNIESKNNYIIFFNLVLILGDVDTGKTSLIGT